MLSQSERIVERQQTSEGDCAEAQASYYRAYVLNDDGQIVDFAQLYAIDDEDAKRQAKHLRDGFDIEVWQQNRKVALLKSA